MGELSDFEKGQIVGARLVGASMTKTATLLTSNGYCIAAYFAVAT
jgi:hypothetical protein